MVVVVVVLAVLAMLAMLAAATATVMEDKKESWLGLDKGTSGRAFHDERMNQSINSTIGVASPARAHARATT